MLIVTATDIKYGEGGKRKSDPLVLLNLRDKPGCSLW